MKTVLKYILGSLLGATLLVLTIYAYISSSKAYKHTLCNNVRVEITDSLKLSFVSDKDIRKFLDKKYGPCQNVSFKELNLHKIETIIDSISAVKKSSVFLTTDGALNIKVTQKEPTLRFQSKNRGFYADAEGNIFPLQKNHTALVPIIDGYIPFDNIETGDDFKPDSTSRVWIKNMLTLTNFMKESGWAEKIVQIYVHKDGNIILVPREGKEKFIFGPPVKIEDKFTRMEKYYTSIKPSPKGNNYSKVDLRYRKQIICSK